MEEKRLLPAPLDGKNVTTDWIEGLFDDGSVLYGSHKAVGFMGGAVMKALWSENCLVWRVLDGDTAAALATLRKRYGAHYPEETSPFTVREELGEDLLIQRFYWKPENE